MFSIPVAKRIINISKPKPEPLCLTDPYRRRSGYHTTRKAPMPIPHIKSCRTNIKPHSTNCYIHAPKPMETKYDNEQGMNNFNLHLLEYTPSVPEYKHFQLCTRFIASSMYMDKYLSRYIRNAMKLDIQKHSQECLYSGTEGVSKLSTFFHQLELFGLNWSVRATQYSIKGSLLFHVRGKISSIQCPTAVYQLSMEYFVKWS